MNNRHGGVIWTNHALNRLRERGIKQSDAWATFRRPDNSRYASSRGGWVYYKTWRSETIEVVAKQNESKEWIILSVWSKPAVQSSNAKVRQNKGFIRQLVNLLFNK